MDGGGLLCVHAHPDDETITTGGVLARAAEEGLPASVVTCTDGALGEIVGEGMDPDEVRPRLVEVRRAELIAALAELGLQDGPRFLGYRDSGMMGTEGNADPRAFWQADLDDAVGRLVAQIRALRPRVVVTYDPFGGYGHPDHIQTHRVGMLAAEAAGIPVMYPDAGPAWRPTKVYYSALPQSTVAEANRQLAQAGLVSPFGEETDAAMVPVGTPDERITTRVDVRRWLPRKQAALRAHTSQIGPDSFFLNFPEEVAEGIFGRECFVRFRSDVAVPQPEDDLFAGLR